MDIHKPKAWHGVREFLKEYAIIVVGVLTALAAEQLVETWRWRHKIDEAQGAMRMELAEDDGPQAYARAISAACLDTQLEGLEALAAQRPDRRAFRRAALDYSPLQRSWDVTAWQAAIASDVGTHMGAGELGRWSDPYRVLPDLQRLAAQEAADLAALVGLPASPGPLTEAEADQVAHALAGLRSDNLGLGLLSTLFLASIEQTGAGVSATERTTIRKDARDRFGACVREPDIKRLRKSGRLVSEGTKQFLTESAIRSWLGLPTRR
jgi:hypothetical protein